uniref:Uncharacterized protein n=1 Tax=Rhizophora mucronata TaxID=61149 RepID=A0A2P2JV34_RHIMU
MKRKMKITIPIIGNLGSCGKKLFQSTQKQPIKKKMKGI